MLALPRHVAIDQQSSPVPSQCPPSARHPHTDAFPCPRALYCNQPCRVLSLLSFSSHYTEVLSIVKKSFPDSGRAEDESLEMCAQNSAQSSSFLMEESLIQLPFI